ncbi:MAG: flippase-like domain-containing protein [Dehalococcoidia bacterium]|nr:flippase-like domain-containing protein [Dehalococcoidia bacterium]
MKDAVVFALKVAVGVGLVVWLVWQEDPARVWQHVRDANILLLLVAFALYLVAILLGAYKWRVLLAAQGLTAPLPDVIRATFVGLFFGNFLPSNVGGDVVRAYELSLATANGPATSASVIVDRLTGSLVFVGSAVILGIVSVVWLGEPTLVSVTLISAAVFAGGLLVFASMLSRRVARAFGWFLRLAPQLNPLHATFARIAEAFQLYRGALGAVARVAVVSLGIQCLTAVVNWIIGLSLHFDVPFVYYFVFNPLIAFILLVPITINGIGVKQMVYVFFYHTVTGHVSEAQALTLSLLMHSIVIVSGLLGGVAWLTRPRVAAAPRPTRSLPANVAGVQGGAP